MAAMSTGDGDGKGSPPQGVPAPRGDVSPHWGLSQTQALHFPALPLGGDTLGVARGHLGVPLPPCYTCTPRGLVKPFPARLHPQGCPRMGGGTTSRHCSGSTAVWRAGVGMERLHLQNAPVTLLFLNYVIISLIMGFF